MAWAIECVILCGLFTLLIVPPLLKDPLSQIASYPPEIQDRVKGLPQYAYIFAERKAKHIIRKIAAVPILCLLFAALAYLAGERDFVHAFLYVFAMFAVLNLYDLLVLDIGWFCHSMRVRIPGTEDMEHAYKRPRHHIAGALKGLAIGFAVSALAAVLVQAVG